jgi:CRISPR-associated endonuclease/helicase Cas3
MSTPTDFAEFFEQLTSGNAEGTRKPYEWQVHLANDEKCSNRLIRIPTGFGKTLGVLSAWLWHTWKQREAEWPRRLLICLPMRVLVEQTEQEVRTALSALGILWDEKSEHDQKIGVHVLMGGIESGEWYLYPEHLAVLICTQDMALSRGINRGYTVPRARWPAEFGLLNQDTLWVMDEVQLMDVGLATSAQLQAFREADRAAGRGFRPCYTWWMSATLQPTWLEKSPDTDTLTDSLPATRIAAEHRTGHLWDDVAKPCRVERIKDAKALATLVAEQHVEHGNGRDGPTLVVVNTVERATSVFEALRKRANKGLEETNVRLVHSRFRPHERRAWRADFLNRAACSPGTNRIVVATQVIEAGVDISAALLVTELAPWASLVQRFGRGGRWGGHAVVIVAGLGLAGGRCGGRFGGVGL